MAYEADRAASRARRRGKVGRMAAHGRPMDFGVLPDIEDPPEFLEARRGILLQALLIDAAETDDRDLRARICLHLLRLSSMGRAGIDLVHSLSRDELPDLSAMLSEADLIHLIDASPQALEGLARRLSLVPGSSDDTSPGGPAHPDQLGVCNPAKTKGGEVDI